MRKTDLLIGSEARERIYKGVNKLADIVILTLGAKGRNVAIALQDYQGNIFKRDIIHDGVRVAKEVNLEDEFENMGASVLREAAEKTVTAVGDGTTVTVLLGRAIYNGAYKSVATGADPVEIKEGLEKAVQKLVAELPRFAYPIKTLEQATQIATISCQEGPLGKLIAETLFELGKEGIVTIEESKSSETTIEHQAGMQLDKGFYSDWFITDPETMTATCENPYILVTDKPINDLVPLQKLLEEIHNRQASLVIISPSIGGVALPLLAQNKASGKLNVLAIQAPSFGDNQRATLQDIAYLTGARFIANDMDNKFEDVILEDLGHSTYVKSDKHISVIVGGKGDKKQLAARIESIRKLIIEEEGEFEKQKLEERLGRLTSGIAVVYVGGFTEIEMKDRKERVIDAVAATKAAMKKGIVPGGEVVFLKLRESLKLNSVANEILYSALAEPFNTLVGNAGLDAGQMRERLSNSDAPNKGVDVRDGKIKDMIEAGIVDPLLVLENALYNSISVANQLIITEGIIVPRKEGDDQK